MAPLRRQSSARLLPIALALVAACGDDSTGVPSLGGSGVTVTASPTAVTAIQGDESELFTVTVTRQGNYTGNTLVRIRETSAPPVGVTVVGRDRPTIHSDYGVSGHQARGNLDLRDLSCQGG